VNFSTIVQKFQNQRIFLHEPKTMWTAKLEQALKIGKTDDKLYLIKSKTKNYVDRQT